MVVVDALGLAVLLLIIVLGFRQFMSGGIKFLKILNTDEDKKD